MAMPWQPEPGCVCKLSGTSQPIKAFKLHYDAGSREAVEWSGLDIPDFRAAHSKMQCPAPFPVLPVLPATCAPA